MVIIGLTGSIGMGKSTAARLFRLQGIAVHDADAVVHRHLRPGGLAVKPISAAFPDVVQNGAVDRKRLGDRVFDNPDALRRLEAILHPLVARSTMRFLRRQMRERRHVVVLDIPLLYETGREGVCDIVIVVSAPARLQALRVLSRPGMTVEKLQAVRRRQLSDVEKRRRADYTVCTALGRRETLRALKRIVAALQHRAGRSWSPHWYSRYVSGKRA